MKPCEWYKEEYKVCQSFKGKFHQYFLTGETPDCSQWYIDQMHCLDYRQKGNEESLVIFL